MTECVISISGITKEFPDVRALDNLDLQISQGIFGLIGPNGAGKTTLIRILLGLIKPSAGRAKILGHDVVKDSIRLRRRIGVLHEDPAFPKELKVLDYLEIVAKLYGSEKEPRRLLEMVDLLYAENRRIGNLSAGMCQRLGIAQALIGNPELVILDEPTSNLDVIGRNEVLELIVRMHRDLGVSFFIASHILSELERTCHSVAFIHQGRIIEQGNVMDVIKKHTEGRFRIRTSDSELLLSALNDMHYLEAADATGPTTITVTISPHKIELLEAEIEKVAKSLGINIYGVEPAYTLEDAFKEMLHNA